MTKKQVVDGSAKVFSAPYCRLQNTLAYQSPIAYTCGVYGWNCDVYDLGYNISLTTGYAPFGKEIPTEVFKEIEKTAEKVDAETAYQKLVKWCMEN